MNKRTITFLAFGLAGLVSSPALAGFGPAPKGEAASSQAAPTKPSAAMRLASYWGKKHGLSQLEIAEQARAIEEAVKRTRGPDHEGFEVPERYAFKYRTLGVPKGSKRNAIILRSNQPSPENLGEIAVAVKMAGIAPEEVAVINLRAENNTEATYHRDFAKSFEPSEKEAAKFQMHNVRILDHTIPRVSQVVDVLKVLSDPKIKVAVVHCKAGKARTGIMVAAARIALDGWSIKDALDEAEERGLTRPLQVAFLKQFAADWKAGKINLASEKL